MAKPKQPPKTTALAGIQSGGVSTKGDVIFFEFKSQEGKAFRFSCPHEAVGEIIAKLFNLAAMSHKARGNPATFDLPDKLKMTFQTVTDFKIRSSETSLILMLLCGPLQYLMGLTPEQTSTLARNLLESVSQWEQRFRPN